MWGFKHMTKMLVLENTIIWLNGHVDRYSITIVGPIQFIEGSFGNEGTLECPFFYLITNWT